VVKEIYSKPQLKNIFYLETPDLNFEENEKELMI
jgi:hypothetical protein